MMLDTTLVELIMSIFKKNLKINVVSVTYILMVHFEIYTYYINKDIIFKNIGLLTGNKL